MKKLVLLLMLFGATRSFGAVATNVQNLSQFGTTNRAMPGDGIGLSTRYATGSERLMGIQVTNLIKSLNALGIATNTVLIAAGTNVVISTNLTTSNVTYTISVTNAFASGADVVWTNNQGIIHPVELNGQATNSIQIYTNGGMGVGRATLAFWGSPPGSGGETLISVRNTNVGDIDLNEINIGVQASTNFYGHDFFSFPSISRRFNEAKEGPAWVRIDEYVEPDTSNVVFRAHDINASGDFWHFRPGGFSPLYTFNSVFDLATNDHIVELQNNTTNKFVVRGDSHVGINTNEPAYPLHIFVDDASKTAQEISYTSGAGNTVAFQIRNGTGATNFQVQVGGLVKSVTIHNSGSITSDVVTATSLNVLGGTLGAGKLLTDVSGTGAATWQSPAANSGALTPGVRDVASAATIVIDLAATNTPLISVTNPAEHNISIVLSNPYPGRWFSFYVDGSGGVTNNALTWSSVAGLQLKWLDLVTNTVVVSNGYVNVSGWVATMNRNTNMVITYRDE